MNMMLNTLSPASPVARDDLITIIRRCGLTSGLQLCLDAGSDTSAPSGGSTWLDLSGGGYDFYRGSGSGSDAADPTFNGTVGRRSSGEYWSSDGGDNFTYDTGANESWMQSLGKNGTAVSAFGVVYLPSNSTFAIYSNHGTGPSQHGGALYYSPALGNKFVYLYSNSAGSSFATIGGAGPDLTSSIPLTVVFGWSNTIGNGTTYRVMINGTLYSSTSTPLTPSSTNPTQVLKLFSRGDANEKGPNGARYHSLAIWTGRELQDSDFRALYQCTRGKYGL